MLLLHTIHTTRTNSLKELIACKLLHLQIACNEHLTVISSEVASAIILGPKCQQTRLLKEKEEYLVHQNSHSSSTIVYVGSELGETDDFGHSGHSLFQYECISTNQNGMLLVIPANITQYISLLVCVAFIM